MNMAGDVLNTSTITNADSTGRRVAAHLLDAGCVQARTDEPFRLPSGWASPVYMDCRRLIAFPAIRRELVGLGVARLREAGALAGVTAIAGGESSGIALAAWIADALDLPLAFVRKKLSGPSRIEGVIGGADTVLLVDDMMAAGQSKARFCRTLRAAGARIAHAFVVFDYDTFSTSRALAPLGLQVHALATWRDVLAVANERGALAPAACKELQTFLADPAAWSLAHGGVGATPPVSDHVEELS